MCNLSRNELSSDMKCHCYKIKVRKVSYACFSHVLQDEANNLSSCCVDVFVSYEGHVVCERLDVPKKDFTEIIIDSGRFL